MTFICLAIGIGVSFFLSDNLKKKVGQLFGPLSKACVVGIGFGLHVEDFSVVDGRRIVLIGCAVLLTLALGYWVGTWMRLATPVMVLITVGTAICGGSAIATVAPLIQARRQDVVVAIASIFILNGVALFIFPVLGRVIGLSDSLFGLWAGVAVHDTSSVIAVSAIFSEASVKTAVIIKAIRTCFIVPVAVGVSIIYRRRSEIKGVPWFLGILLVVISLVNMVPIGEPSFQAIYGTAKQLTAVPIFLLGASFCIRDAEKGGLRPIIFATLLWCGVSLFTLGVIFFH